MTADAGQRLSPLAMALNLARTVQPLAEALDRDPVQGAVLHLGDRAHAAAQLAANLAVVSIAQDLHQLMGVMLFGGELPEDGAITEARATREHMRRWAAGDDTHQGET